MVARRGVLRGLSGFDLPPQCGELISLPCALSIGALEHGGIVPRGYLGVNIQPVTEDMAESMGMKTAKGAIVAEAMSGTPAAEPRK